MNDDQRLLASAALDGAVTAEERARADADPEVRAEIERLRAVRAALAVDTPPDAARREASIAAAVAAFEAPVTAPPPVSLDDRRRARWLAPVAAAAAVAVIAVGVVVAVRGGGGGSDDAASDAAATEATANPADTDAAGAAPASTTVVAAPQIDEDGGGDEELEAPAATESAADVAEGTSNATDLETTMSAEAERLRSPGELAVFARTVARGDAAALDATCDAGTLLGVAYYVSNGTEVLVEVYEVAQPHEAIAVRIDGCTVVARAPLP